MALIQLSEAERELFTKLDFKYFLEKHLEISHYEPYNINLLYQQYEETTQKLKTKQKQNRKQFYYYLEGQIRKMYSGGFLISHFRLNEMRNMEILNFTEYGEGWAYFEIWQSVEKKKRLQKLLWRRLVEIGCILAYILTILKIIESVKIK